MADEMLQYFERELSFLRHMGAEFAANYPKIAGRLLLDADKCEDPHVERLIQACALLAARVHHKLDDELPEITEALLTILYPHYLAPIPAMGIAHFVLDPEAGKLTSGHRIPRGSMLYSEPVGGAPCRFRTCYPVDLWPVRVKHAQFAAPDAYGAPRDVQAVLRLELECQSDCRFVELPTLERLRFFLHGESAFAFGLYELLCNDVTAIQFRSPEAPGRAPLTLPASTLRAVGFEDDEGMLPYRARSFAGYRLLQEYFSFPEKFLFVDLGGLEHAAGAGFGRGLEVVFFLRRTPRLEQPLRPDSFRLGCTPMVNLFDRIAEPIRVDQAHTEYRVVGDVARQGSVEIYSVNAVTTTPADGSEPVPIEPFYSLRHASGMGRQPFWHAARRLSPRKDDPGTEVYLQLVDLDFRATQPPGDTVTVHVTCSNRDLPAKLPFGGDRGDLQLEGAAPLSRIRCLTKPTETLRPPLRSKVHWRLISHLTLNYLSIAEGGRDALQEILRLYDFSGSAVFRQQIAGIVGVASRRVVARPTSKPWNGFCRGVEVTVEFDETKYVGSGLFLFASVLERFFGLYAAINSFTQLVATTLQREQPVRIWPPRAGTRVLL